MKNRYNNIKQIQENLIMSKLTDIKRKIDELDGGAFQNLCDAYLYCKGYGNGYSLGMHTGTDKTAKGNPDTYFLTADNKYVFVMYTTQKTDFVKKAIEDIEKCFDNTKTGVKSEEVTEIIYCHTYGRLTVGDDKYLRNICEQKGAILTLIGLDTLGNEIFLHYPIIAKDQLNISVGTGQITSIASFVQIHDKNKMSVPLNTEFMFREKEIEEACRMLYKSNVLIIYGPAGVGKTRFSLELCKILKEKQGYETMCIKSNGLEIYEDLLSVVEPNKNYVALIDDANELAGLQFVLNYLQGDSGKRISKIIITVRDYARENVIKKVLDYEKPEKIKIGIFKDEDIKKLMKVCYDIKNNFYSDRIIAISEGNARIAMLAGKLLKETGKLESIMDASELYVNYYGKQLADILSSSKTEIYSAGIIAFLQSIRLDNLEKLFDVFSAVSLTVDDFVADIKHLYSLELVDLCNEKAAKISDQSFSNFLIKYVFIDKKFIPLDLMIKVCFAFNKSRTISACNILFNVFSDPNVQGYLERQINKVWDEMKDDGEKFPAFFQAFHMIRPTETLLLLKERIEDETSIDFDVTNIEFEDNNDGIQITDEIIEVLCSFNNCNQLPEAIELLIKYYTKRPDLFNEVYTAFIRELGIDKDSYRFKYYSITKSVEYLCNYIETNNDNNALILFVRVAAYYLNFTFSKTEGGRRKTFTFYTIPITATPEVIKYREMLLNELKCIYCEGKCNKEIERMLKRYCTGYIEHVDYRIVKEEYNDILSILSMLNTDNLYHCSIVDHIKHVFEDAEIEYEHTILDSFIESPKNRIFHALKGNRKDVLSMSYEEERKHRYFAVENLIDTYCLEDYEFLLQVAKEAETFIKNDSYNFSTGLSYVFDIASKKDVSYMEIVESYLCLDTPCNVFPVDILKNLFELVPADEVKALIEKYDFTQKNTWLWYFYAQLPESDISSKYADEVLDFLSKPPAQLKSAGYRHLECLKKYESVNLDIFERASHIILDNYDKSPFVFSLYFQLLFNCYHISPQNLIELYSFDESLLLNIYLKCIEYTEHIDYNGMFLLEFLKINPDFIDAYLNQAVQQGDYKYKKYDTYMERLRKIWEEQDYINKINHIIELLFSKLKDRRWDFEECTKSLFALEQNNEDIISRQDEWINQVIEDKHTDCDFMCGLFEVVSEFPNDRRRKTLLKFLSRNYNYDDFEKLSLEPSSWGGSGSMIPYMQNRITYLSSLIPYLSGVKYLKHKQRVERYIEIWNERINQEEIRELLEDWF